MKISLYKTLRKTHPAISLWLSPIPYHRQAFRKLLQAEQADFDQDRILYCSSGLPQKQSFKLKEEKENIDCNLFHIAVLQTVLQSYLQEKELKMKRKVSR